MCLFLLGRLVVISQVVVIEAYALCKSSYCGRYLISDSKPSLLPLAPLLFRPFHNGVTHGRVGVVP